MNRENTEMGELQRRLHDSHESSARLRETIDRMEGEIEEAKRILRKELDRDHDPKDTLRTLVVVAVNALHYERQNTKHHTPTYWADKLRTARELVQFEQIVDEIGKEAGVRAHAWWGEYLYVDVPMTDYEKKIPEIQQGLAPPTP